MALSGNVYEECVEAKYLSSSSSSCSHYSKGLSRQTDRYFMYVRTFVRLYAMQSISCHTIAVWEGQTVLIACIAFKLRRRNPFCNCQKGCRLYSATHICGAQFAKKREINSIIQRKFKLFWGETRYYHRKMEVRIEEGGKIQSYLIK